MLCKGCQEAESRTASTESSMHYSTTLDPGPTAFCDRPDHDHDSGLSCSGCGNRICLDCRYPVADG